MRHIWERHQVFGGAKLSTIFEGKSKQGREAPKRGERGAPPPPPPPPPRPARGSFCIFEIEIEIERSGAHFGQCVFLSGKVWLKYLLNVLAVKEYCVFQHRMGYGHERYVG